MKTDGPIWNSLRAILALGMLFSLAGVSSRPAFAAPASALNCATPPVRLSLAGEQITFCSPTDSPFHVVEDSLTDPNVNYAGLDQAEGYAFLNIRAAVSGVQPGPGMPVYHSGELEKYRRSLRELFSSQPDRTLSDGPAAFFWGETVPSLQIDAQLSTSLGSLQMRTLEWDVEHNNRLWVFILSWDRNLQNASSWEDSSEDFRVQATSGTKLADTALDLGKAYAASRFQPDTFQPEGGPVTVSLPAWWDEQVCDYDDYYEGTGIAPVALGLPWKGIYPCGTSPTWIMQDFGVQFYPGAWGQYEWECVELVNRFLYLQWGIAPIHGNARELKDNYPHGTMDFYPNDGTHPIVPGDILTEDASIQNSAGHTMVVTGTHTDGSGEEWVDIMEQNTGAPGAARSIHITDGIVDNDSWCFHQVIQGWLHVKANTTSGDPDPAFTLTGSGFNGPVTALGLQSSGKIIAGGDFISYNGVGYNHILRLNTDGSLDLAFDPGDGISASGTPQVFALKVQSDDKVLVGGYFDQYNLVNRKNLTRLNANGSLDTTFNIGTAGVTFADFSPASVNAIAIQSSDGKILIGGSFDTYNGTTRHFLARAGTTDGGDDGTNFPNPGGTVYALAVQPDDGKILVGGSFIKGILRLNSNGTLDGGFNPGTGADGPVKSIVLQDDKILIGGNFTHVNAASRSGIARLNSDGSLDTTFNPGTGVSLGMDKSVESVVLQPDGRILIGGSFSAYNGAIVNNLVRINNDGSREGSFNPVVNDMVKAILLQPDAKVLIGGGNSTNYIKRLLNTLEACYHLITALTPPGGGDITINPPRNCPGNLYISGTEVQLTAVPNTAQEFQFMGWSDAYNGITNPITLTMNSNKSILADFLDPPHPFGKISPLNTTTVGPIVSLSWQASDNATSYEYCLVDASGPTPDICDTETGTWISTGANTSIAFSTLLPLHTYNWNIMAANQAGTTHANSGLPSWSFTRDSSVPLQLFLPLVSR